MGKKEESDELRLAIFIKDEKKGFRQVKLAEKEVSVLLRTGRQKSGRVVLATEDKKKVNVVR